MSSQDDKSEICRLASQLESVATLYEKASTKVEEPGTASWLLGRAECRREMMRALLARAGLSGEAAGSALSLPEALWLKVISLVSTSDEAVIRPICSADRTLLQMVEDYLSYSDASGQAATAARWLRNALEAEIGQLPDTVVPPNQSG